jgi:hypothetical protein
MDMDSQTNINEEHVKQLREIAVNLLKSGMSFPDVINEVYRVSKRLSPHQAFILEHISVAAAYTGAATEGLNSKPQRQLERK